jgi:hypothetical protein
MKISAILVGLALLLAGVYFRSVNQSKWSLVLVHLTSAVTKLTTKENCMTIGKNRVCDLVPLVEVVETVSVDLQYPNIARATEPFVVSVVVSGATTQEDLAPYQIMLSLAGADVQPKDWLNFPQHRIDTQWSILEAEPGAYPIVLNIRSVAQSTANAPAPLNFKVPSDKQVIVKGRWIYYFSKFWPYAVTVLGAFITLPGLLSLLKDLRRKKTQPIGFVTR